MNFPPLILLLGAFFPRWTTATSVTYDVSYGILENVTSIDASKINLTHLGIKVITFNSLDALRNVESLDLSNNELVYLPPMIFSKMVNLRELLLSNNSMLLFSNAFLGLTKLENLDLSDNSIYTLNNAFLGLDNLKYLDLSRNPISFLERGDLFGLTKSIKINVEGTRLSRFSTGIFKDPSVPVPTKNETTELDENFMFFPRFNYSLKVCKSDDGILESIEKIESDVNMGNCTLKHDDAYIYDDKEDENSISVSFINKGVSKIKDGAFGKLNLTNLYLSLNRLESIAFARTLPTTIRVLDISNNNISEVPLDSFYGLKNLEFLSMDHNEVNNIKPGTFKDQNKLTTLKLRSNRISSLKPGFLQGLDRLENIDLSENVIKRIPSNLFEGWNHLPTKFSLNLDGNYIKIIEDGAFSHMKISHLSLLRNDFEDNSIGEGIFSGADISEISFESNALTRFNGEWFRGVSGLENVHLSSRSVRNVEKGFAKYMENVTFLELTFPQIRILQNGALFGLSTEKEVQVHFLNRELRIIEGGLFDDL